MKDQYQLIAPEKNEGKYFEEDKILFRYKRIKIHQHNRLLFIEAHIYKDRR